MTTAGLTRPETRGERGAHVRVALFCLVLASAACGSTSPATSGTAGTNGGGGSGARGGDGGQAGTSAQGGGAGAGDHDGGQGGASGQSGASGQGGAAGATGSGGTGGTGGAGGACGSATVGAACSPDGAICGNCTDPCQFCNTLRCQSGHWQMQEGFPAQCFDCGSASVRCELHTQYCKVTTSHVGTSAGCVSLPAGCAPTASCACLANPPLCSQTDGGAVTVTIQAP